MYLGLDLRGGVDFLLQVDMKGAIDKKAESFASDLRSGLRDKGVRGSSVSRNGQTIEVRFRDAAGLEAAKALVQDQFPDLATTESQEGSEWKLVATIKPEAARRLQDAALKQNITTLHNRINELGVAEPVIQQQGLDRIVVQLPGVQDTAKAKDILGPHRHARDAHGRRDAPRAARPRPAAARCPSAPRNSSTARAAPSSSRSRCW